MVITMNPIIRKENSKYQGAACHKAIVEERQKEVVYLTFPMLSDLHMVNHLFSTRLGGHSEGIYESMNLSYSRGDKKEAVDANYATIATLLQRRVDDIVCSDQTHTTNVRRMERSDAGKGVLYERDYTDVDGMITNVPGLVLATFYADCVPLYFVDLVHRAIGLSHSGWRGTVGKIGKETVQAMHREYGTRPEDIYAAIGPSICQECYEVSQDVAEAFQEAFGEANRPQLLYPGKEEGKYQLDLWKANYLVLLEAGIVPKQISVTDICTCCNPKLLFSHRASKGKRGNLGAFLSIN